ncbi:cation-transporting P-type ATPase [Streptomyces sp. B6B3]|uniref:cation-translocating P-type ATPase n=1 Tax=Streptomyces sp. B6B3 TaxID=3153570 RepID=UPI00325F25E9
MNGPAGHASGAGLSAAEAARRLAEHGPNTVASDGRIPTWRRVLWQLRDPLILLLLVAAALTVGTGDIPDTVVIGLVVVANTAVGVAQEARAERALAALKAISAPAARVVRDGRERLVPAAEVVPGDVVLLGEGDIVPADGEVREASTLLVDESALTGESVPVEKTMPFAAIPETVSSGTVVVRGRGRIRVTATGAGSAVGRIASLMSTGPRLTPLQRRLAELGRIMAAVTVALCAVVLVSGLARGQSAELMVVTAISLAVAAVPESMPAVVTLALALGAQRMARRKAIARRLPAVETLGAVTVIASDKTGTLTEGRMLVERLWTPVGEAHVTGSGYEPHGQVRREEAEVTWTDAPDLATLTRAAVLCNDAGLEPPTPDEDRWRALGDPMEAALLTAAARLGRDPDALREEAPRLDEIPFDSARRRMTTIHRLPAGDVWVVTKGAPEVMLRPELLEAPGDVLDQARAAASHLARQGYRVLAVAASAHSTVPEHPETGMALLGLVGILDPPRASARATVAACQAAGLALVVITGDHPLTARAIAARLGVVDPARTGEVVTGEELRRAGAAPPEAVRVYARTTPEQKVDIVEAWRAAGHVVAMTGDGVNDGPALRRADIGVAMGRRGTEVARQAADLVLTNDDLGVVVAAVEEGRRVYGNVRRFLLYGLAGGVAEILVMLVGPAAGMALPLLPAQILWINLLTHGLPGVALGAEPAEADVMRRRPRSPTEGILGGGLWLRLLLLGALTATLSLGAAIWARELGWPWQSVLFLVLGAIQLGLGLGSRARPRSLANPFLLVAVAAALALQVAGVCVPALRTLLGTEPVPVEALLLAAGLAAVGYTAMRLQTGVRR